MFISRKTKEFVLNKITLFEKRYQRKRQERQNFRHLQSQLSVCIKLIKVLDMRVKLLEQKSSGKVPDMTARAKTDSKGNITGLSLLVDNVREKQPEKKSTSINGPKAPKIIEGGLSKMFHKLNPTKAVAMQKSHLQRMNEQNQSKA